MEENKTVTIELADFNPKESAPVFNSVRGKDYVPYTTPDGKKQYGDFLIELMNNSAVHGAIIRAKIAQTIGNGIVWDAEDGTGEDEALAEFMTNINDEYDANELISRMAPDLILGNTIALLVTWTADWSKIGSVKHIDATKIRAATVDQNGKIPGYWYSWDWSKQRNDKVFLPIYNFKSAADSRKAYQEALKKGNNEELQKIFLQPTTQIFVYKPYAPGQFYYSLPDYIGAIASIQTDILSDQYGVASFQNGLNTDVMVTFFGLRTPEQKTTEAKKFLQMHTGAAKSKKPLIAFADDVNQAPKVEMIGGSKEDKIFTTINERCLQNILTGHRVTDPLLVGIKTAGQLGAGEELKNSIEFWNNTVIRPYQIIIENILNEFTYINGLEPISIEPFVFVETQSVEQPDSDIDNVTDEDVSADNPTEEDVEMDKMIKVNKAGDIKKAHAYTSKKKISTSLKNKKKFKK